MKIQIQTLALLGATVVGCGTVKQTGPSIEPDAPTPVTPDAPETSPYASCAAIAAALPGAPSDEYAIDPDGAGGNAAFHVLCEMAVLGGGWTQVNDDVAKSLAPNVNRSYLYLYGSAAYESPCTSLAWSWADGAGLELTGTYSYLAAAGPGTFVCAGSAEKPSWGVGCSNGPGGVNKVLPINTKDSTAGTSAICQDIPNAFASASGPCASNVVIFEREGCTP